MDSPHTKASIALERYKRKRIYQDAVLEAELVRLRSEVEELRKSQKLEWKRLDAWRGYLADFREKHYGKRYH